MWQRSFLATTLLVGGTVEDALDALGTTSTSPEARSAVDALAARLRERTRAARATALAEAAREIAVAVEEVALR